jgi:DNA-binding transcriptional ArsR family regulator
LTQATETEVDQRILKALSHPLRQRVLRVLNERVASPAEIAEQLGERLGNVSYHVRVLRDAECVELVRTAPVRGALEHFYRATARPFLDSDQWARLPLSTRRGLFGQTLSQIWRDVDAAGGSGGFDRDETHVSWTTLELDEQGWKEVDELLVGALNDVGEIQAESLARLAELPEEERRALRTELVLMHFERAAAKGTAPARRKNAKRSAPTASRHRG